MRTFRTLGAGVVVALVLALTATMFSTTAASAAPSPSYRHRDNWGAIIISVDGGGGFAYGFRTKHAAVHKATQRCKAKSNFPGHCPSYGGWVKNECAALWYQINHKTGYVDTRRGRTPRFKGGHNKPAAIRNARGPHHHGGRVVWVCAG